MYGFKKFAKMKKIITAIAFFSLLVVPFVTDANGSPTLDRVLGNLKTALWGAFTILAVICFMWAGILFLTSSGDPEKMRRAKNALIYGIVGVVVAILGYSIVGIIKTAFGL